MRFSLRSLRGLGSRSEPQPGPHGPSRQAPAALILLCGLASVILLGFLDRSSLVGDEATYAAVAWDSLQSGSIFPLRLGDRLYFEKPPTTIWLLQLSFLTLGPTTFAARLPSALAGLALTAATFWLWRRWIGTSASLLAALVLLTSPGPLLEHGVRRAVTDGWLMVAILLAAERVRRYLEGGGRADLVAVGVLTFLGTWIKGFVAPALMVAGLLLFTCALPVLPDVGGGPSRAIEARRSRLLLGLVSLVGIAASLAWLGCLWAAGAPRVLWKMIYRGVWLRATEGLNPTHLHPPGFYAERVFEDFGLWLVPAALAIAGIGWRRGMDGRERLSMLWLLSWSAGTLLVFLPSVSRLGWYLYPAYPAIALLSAAGAAGVLRKLRGFLRHSLFALIAAGLAMRIVSSLDRVRADVGLSAVESLSIRMRQDERALLYVDPRLRLLERGFTAEDYFYLRSAARTSWSMPARLQAGPCAYLVTSRPSEGIPACDQRPCDMSVLRPRRAADHEDLYLVGLCGADSQTPSNPILERE